MEFPTYRYRIADGELQSRLFEEGPIPPGWYEDKHKAAEAGEKQEEPAPAARQPQANLETQDSAAE